jgi:RNA polymerase sigma factor (sigma-70 family)
MWTAFALSSDAPITWRLQLLFLEGGVPILLAVGCGCAALGNPIIRRFGWGLVVVTIFGLIVWTFLIVPPHPLAVGAAVAALNEASRLQIVEAAYRQYSDHLISYAGALSARSDADIAEEAVHDVFAALLTGQRDDALERDPIGFRAHLFSAVKLRVDTVCRSERRRAHHTSRMMAVDLPTPLLPAPDDQYIQTELERRLRAELKRCSTRGVEAFHLVHDCGLSYAETAAAMGITTQAVGSHLSRILRHLRNKLRDWAPDGAAVKDGARKRAVAGGEATA